MTREWGEWAGLVALALVGTLGAARGAAAQNCSVNFPSASCTATISLTMTAGTLMTLSLSSSTTALTAPTATSFDDGYTDDVGPSATVKSNLAWQLQLHALAATWTATGALARPDKPRGDLTWSTSAGGSYAPVTGSASALTTGTGTDGSVSQLYYRTLYDWTADTPGSYELTLVFTLTTN